MPFPDPLADLAVPPDLIAQYPLPRRDHSRLLLLHRQVAGQAHHRFDDLPRLLAPGTLLVPNDTRVIPARLMGLLPGGGAIEALLLHEESPGRWRAMVKGARRLRCGMALRFAGGALPAQAVERDGAGHWLLDFAGGAAFRGQLDRHGLAPLPPYIRRDNGSDGAADRAAYQTCFARREGAVAAPTAGLHFTPEVLSALEARGISLAALTLHVGPGTFQPIRCADPAQHRMHREWYSIPPETCAAVLRARREKRPVVAVGTTAVRALESWAAAGYPAGIEGETGLYILPPFAFGAVDGLITNFHQPASTLLLLVAAFHGAKNLRAAYDEAIARAYRFFSYGDCMAILPPA